jgi:hypothetical protein
MNEMTAQTTPYAEEGDDAYDAHYTSVLSWACSPLSVATAHQQHQASTSKVLIESGSTTRKGMQERYAPQRLSSKPTRGRGCRAGIHSNLTIHGTIQKGFCGARRQRQRVLSSS